MYSRYLLNRVQVNTSRQHTQLQEGRKSPKTKYLMQRLIHLLQANQNYAKTKVLRASVWQNIHL